MLNGKEAKLGKLGGRWGLNMLNRKQMFTNLADNLDDLEKELNYRFDDVRVDMRGAVALFQASRR